MNIALVIWATIKRGNDARTQKGAADARSGDVVVQFWRCGYLEIGESAIVVTQALQQRCVDFTAQKRELITV